MHAMRRTIPYFCLLTFAFCLLPSGPAQEPSIRLAGLRQPVEVLIDEWGVPHIYAHNTGDLFMGQGFIAARDRLWQMEMWRRQGEGRLAEVLGETAVERDRFARLLRYRGDMEAEWRSYAPDAREIITAFVRGVNAYMTHAKERLPPEFAKMGFRPEPWTPEVCLTRLAGYVMTGNAANEVQRAQLVARYGPEKAAELMPPDPPVPLEVPEGLDLKGIDQRVLALHRTAS
jgi:penicillin amidase